MLCKQNVAQWIVCGNKHDFHIYSWLVGWKDIGWCPLTIGPNACHYNVDVEGQYDEM